MTFYEMTGRQEFASYSMIDKGGLINDHRIIEPHRVVATRLREYLGVPPRKPARRGDFHSSGSSFFIKSELVEVFAAASNENFQTSAITIEGRERESIVQFWCLNFVDCLDIKNTVAPPSSGICKGKIGVIKKPAFDESRWDGSDLFVVPQDPSFSMFASDRFVKKWVMSRRKGAQFSRYLMDTQALRA